MFDIAISSRGVKLSGYVRPSGSGSVAVKGGGRRGCVTTFSASSACRLREALFRYSGDGVAWAFTFTFPRDLSSSDYYRLTKRFFERVRYMRLGMIWRVELTKRRRPHLHCVVYSADVGRMFDLQAAWWDVVNAHSFEGGVEYSCVFRSVSGVRWWQYVAAHTCKAKASQLGWRGRQWGVVGREYFRDDVSGVSVARESYFRVCRVLRRLSKCRNRSRGLFGDTVWFCSEDTARVLAAWAREGSPKP